MSDEKTATDRLSTALGWCRAELLAASANEKYEKRTLIGNLLDRINAALQLWPYEPQRTGRAKPSESLMTSASDEVARLSASLHRWQQIAARIWLLFPTDPLGDDPAHFITERIEALLNRGLLSPSQGPSPSFNHTRSDGPFDPCDVCLRQMHADDLRALVSDLRSTVADLKEQRAGDGIYFVREIAGGGSVIACHPHDGESFTVPQRTSKASPDADIVETMADRAWKLCGHGREPRPASFNKGSQLDNIATALLETWVEGVASRCLEGAQPQVVDGECMQDCDAAGVPCPKRSKGGTDMRAAGEKPESASPTWTAPAEIHDHMRRLDGIARGAFGDLTSNDRQSVVWARNELRTRLDADEKRRMEGANRDERKAESGRRGAPSEVREGLSGPEGDGGDRMAGGRGREGVQSGGSQSAGLDAGAAAGVMGNAPQGAEVLTAPNAGVSPRCEYGTHGEAKFVIHDKRGCYAVCPTHAVWRRTGCSRVGGHDKDCPTPNLRVHATSIVTGECADELLSAGGYAPSLGMKSCGPWSAVEETPTPSTDLDRNRGWYRKYEVRRLNDPNGKHVDCEYFVLDIMHDDHVPAALRAYAKSCADTHPQLSKELLQRFGAKDTDSSGTEGGGT